MPDARIKEKFELLAHKKLAVSASLIQIFQNMDECSQQHALKDYHLKFRKMKGDEPLDNKHGKARREAIMGAMEKLRLLTTRAAVKEYGKAIHMKFDDEKYFTDAEDMNAEEKKTCNRIINSIHAQHEAIFNAQDALKYQLSSNQAMLGLFHHVHIIGIVNPLKKYYQEAQKELSATEELFTLNETFRKKVVAHAKKKNV